MMTWVVVLAGGMLVTYAERLSFLVLARHESMPVSMRRGLRYVAPSVLAALILPDLVMNQGRLALGPSDPRWIAGLAAGLVAWRFRNTWLTIGIGMGLLWLLGSL